MINLYFKQEVIFYSMMKKIILENNTVYNVNIASV